MSNAAHIRAPGLDAMRACAALLVVCAHARIFFYGLAPDLTPILFYAGLGVDLFFVLSGFLVGGLLIDAARPGLRWIPHFWMRRWWRTLPSFYLFLLVNLLLARWLQGQWPDAWAHVLFVQNLAWPHPAFFPEAWSLAIEEWFYLLAPLLFAAFALTAAAPRRVLAVAIALIVLGTLLRWGWVLRFDPAWDAGVKKLAVLRVDAVAWGLLGAAALRLWPQRLHAWRQVLAAAGIAVLVFGAALFFSVDIDHSVIARVVAFAINGLGSVLLLPWLIHWQLSSNPLPARVVAKLALWSYALYLVHLPIMRVWQWVWAMPATWSMAWLQSTSFVVLSIAAAAGVYIVFERPVMRLRERVLPSRRD